MGRGMWILAAILAVLAISQIYMAETGQLDRPWAECKESLFTQVFSNECTPRDGGMAPSTAGAGGDQPAGDGQRRLDDGVGKVDLGQ
ncbi:MULTISPECIES: hypothetical protein [Thalassobaculum]|uniref:Uncharacterized protein n=1 Tax=Thalassobaculum litoreum DSM 18839 TaxID=1123362 RepID=A0A8G2EVW3_9PROT|nr:MULTISPECIES: hypothetical protein [Thalassobaculum]SDG02648.1 hypothetical protein SAMN05660686_03098 [Thalassobaculum litoreum DSM 18839]